MKSLEFYENYITLFSLEKKLFDNIIFKTIFIMYKIELEHYMIHL